MSIRHRSLSDADVIFFHFAYAAIFYMFYWSERHGRQSVGDKFLSAFTAVFTVQCAMLGEANFVTGRTRWLARVWTIIWVGLAVFLTFA